VLQPTSWADGGPRLKARDMFLGATLDWLLIPGHLLCLCQLVQIYVISVLNPCLAGAATRIEVKAMTDAINHSLP
jgi:hypothetical protein